MFNYVFIFLKKLIKYQFKSFDLVLIEFTGTFRINIKNNISFSCNHVKFRTHVYGRQFDIKHIEKHVAI